MSVVAGGGVGTVAVGYRIRRRTRRKVMVVVEALIVGFFFSSVVN